MRGETGIVVNVAAGNNSSFINQFSAEIDAQPDDFYSNVIIQTVHEGSPESAAAGLFSFIEGESNTLVGIGTNVRYIGAGGTMQNFEMPTVVGMISAANADAGQDLFLIGSMNSAHYGAGINIGSYVTAVSENAFYNIGLYASVIDQDYETQDLDVLDSLNTLFPDRFRAAALLHNHETDSSSFNLYASGTAKSFFGGDVGIGKISPQSKLDVAGAVNATEYLLNGEPLSLGDGAWNTSGNDIYFNSGNVLIGMHPDSLPDVVVPAFGVAGNVFLTSNTQTELSAPLGFFIMNSDTSHICEGLDTLQAPGRPHIMMGLMDTIGSVADTQMFVLQMGACSQGNISGMLGYKSPESAHVIGINHSFESEERGLFFISMDGGNFDEASSGSFFILNPAGSYLLHGGDETFAQFIFMTDSALMLGTNIPDTDDLSTILGLRIDTASMVLGKVYGEDGRIEITDEGVRIGKLLQNNLHVTGNVSMQSDTMTSVFPYNFFLMNDGNFSQTDTPMAVKLDSMILFENQTQQIMLGMLDTTSGSDTIAVFLGMVKTNTLPFTYWGYGKNNEESMGVIAMSPDASSELGGINLITKNASNSSMFQMKEQGMGMFHGDISTSVGSYLQMDTVSMSFEVKGADSSSVHITRYGIGINTNNPDTELHVNGDIKQNIYSYNVSNPPTTTELNSLFTSPASKGNGWTAYIQDDDSDNFYQIVVSGSKWLVFTGVEAQ